MKITENALLKSCIWISAFLWFYQVGFLQLWRCIPALSAFPTAVGFISFLLIFSTLSFLLIHTTSMVSSIKTQHSYQPTIKDILYGILILITALIPWFIWVEPQLNRPPNTYGDEDFHFQATLAITHYISAFFHGTLSSTPAPEAYRYSGLMYLLFSLVTILNKHIYLSPFIQRIGLLIPFLFMGLITFICAYTLLKNKILSFLFTLVISTSPLLLAFTTDKYLDIGHVPLFFLLFTCLYWGISKKNINALTLAGVIASLMPLIRENAIPTTLLISAFLGLYGTFIYPKRFSWATLIATATILPFLLFYYFKLHFLAIDTDRLSLHNAFHQDYQALFKMAFIYFNPIILTFSVIALFWKDNNTRLVIALIFASIFGQLAIYALFQPGWMPWSRNYLMFHSQFIFLALLGIRWIQQYSLKLKSTLHLLLIFAILFNCFLDKHQLNRNQFFHEIEIRYDYLALFNYLSTTQDIPKKSVIYLQAPIAIPYSFRYSQEIIENKRGKPFSFSLHLIEKNHQAASFENMMTFNQFIKLAPHHAQYFLFHWWVPGSDIKIISTYPQVLRPTPTELAHYQVLFKSYDPWSDGKAGLMLLKHVT